MNRDYSAPQFKVQDTRQYQQDNVAQSDNSAAAPIKVGDSQWRDKMLTSILGQAEPVLNKLADVSYSRLYLEGQAKAGIIQSEDEIQGNAFTRDWELAGYRDTMGKLALADTEAQFGVDITKLREGGTDALQGYLSERRNKLMPMIAGMSADARSAAAGQLLLQDRTAIRTHSTEHQKYIIETETQAVQTQWNTSVKTMEAAKVALIGGNSTEENYNDALRSGVATVVGSVWMNPKLPDDAKQALTAQMLEQALTQDNVKLYDFVDNNPIADKVGGTLLSRLTGDQQVKLSKQYTEAMNRTADARNLYRTTQIANVEAQIDNDAYAGSYQDLIGLITPMVNNKSLDASKAGSLVNKFLDKQYKREAEGDLAGAYLRGDASAIYGAGKEFTDGAQALDAQLARRGATPDQRLDAYLMAGSNGMEGGFKKAGEFLGVGLRQVRSADGTMLPQHLETVKKIFSALGKAKADGKLYAETQLLSGMSTEDSLFTKRIIARVEGGASYDEAVRQATDAEAKEASMSPAMRAAHGTKVAKEVTDSIGKVEARGLFATMWGHVKAVVSPEARTDLTLRPSSYIGDRDGWFSNSPTVKFYENRVREELTAEADRVLLTSPTASADEVMSTAKANVAARTIETDFGPLTLPHGTKVAQVFGVAPANTSMIGPALSAMLKETKDGSNWQLTFSEGRLFAQEFDRAGARIGTGTFVNPTDVNTKIQDITKQQQKAADEVFGVGKEVWGDNVKVGFNGDNTAGAPNSWMFYFRDNLVAHEGIKSKPYPDGKYADGRQKFSVGVGVNSANPHYPPLRKDGTVDVHEIERSFVRASNDAARAGRRVAQTVGVYNREGFMLMSELAYQSGPAFVTQKGSVGDQYRAFTGALRGKDVKAAQEAFKQTAAWRNSPDKRQKSYLKLIEKTMKG